MTRIVILYTLPTQRLRKSGFGVLDEDSGVIAGKVAWALKQNGYQTKELAVDENSIDKISSTSADCVFNLCEWCGRDAMLARQVFKNLKKRDIPFTGSSEEAYFLSDNKIEMKKTLSKHKVTIPRGETFVTGNEELYHLLPYPVIVKPSNEHCSVGLTRAAVAHDAVEARGVVKKQIAAFEQPVIAEEFVRGREILAYMLEVRGEVQVLPLEEVKFAGNDPMNFQTYESKWTEGHPDYNAVEVELAKLNRGERESVEQMCKRAYAAMKLSGYGRIDLRLRNGVPVVLEVNANPSVYDDEAERVLEPDSQVIYGIKFVDYIKAIVESAFDHYRAKKV